MQPLTDPGKIVIILLTNFKMHVVFNSLRPSDTYICFDNLAIIGSDNGLSPGRRQAII